MSTSTGATRVHVFSHILRNDSRDKAEAKVKADPSLADDDAPFEDVVPARFIHIDQSAEGAAEVVRDNLHPPELAEKLMKTRWGIINVWRPIKPIHKVNSSALPRHAFICIHKLTPCSLGSFSNVRLAYCA